MAYAMGIIDKPYRKKIDLIREIRNACAYARFPLTMETKVLINACKALLAATWDDLKDHDPLTIRNAFLVECKFIAHYILSGEKIEGHQAQLLQKFWGHNLTSPSGFPTRSFGGIMEDGNRIFRRNFAPKMGTQTAVQGLLA